MNLTNAQIVEHAKALVDIMPVIAREPWFFCASGQTYAIRNTRGHCPLAALLIEIQDMIPSRAHPDYYDIAHKFFYMAGHRDHVSAYDHDLIAAVVVAAADDYSYDELQETALPLDRETIRGIQSVRRQLELVLGVTPWPGT